MQRPRATIVFVIACSLFVTCGVSSASPARGAAVDRPAATSPAFPVSVKSGDGTVRIASRPDRILCLSASATQMLYEMGAGSQIVGVDEYSTWPANAPRTKFTGDESSAEDYLYLRPDLVIFAFSSGTLIQQLEKLHIPVLLLPSASTIGNVDSQLGELGTATGHQSGAKSVEATFIGAEFSLFGMRDIADAAGHGSQYPQISPEYILKEDPDYVFLADTVCCGATSENFARRPGFSVLKAVRLHHVVGVNDSVASQWGPHTMEAFVSLLARVLRQGAPSS